MSLTYKFIHCIHIISKKITLHTQNFLFGVQLDASHKVMYVHILFTAQNVCIIGNL